MIVLHLTIFMPVQVLDFLVAGVKLGVPARTDDLLASARVFSTKEGRKRVV